jgi:hypothetical protein
MRLTYRAIPVALLLLSLSTLLLRPRRAETLPLYAARTGLMCQSCHFDPNGGGARNDFGFAFARNRHALEPEDSTSEWHDLDVTNRVGDRMPVYLGVNQRFMLLADAATKSDSLDRLGFFNMENALTVTFQPHRRLALVYNRDGFNESSVTRDAFGMIGGFPYDGYFKAGRFRNPFGLRMDDHTVATRNGFLDFFDGRRFLPFDPRTPDMGYEIGVTPGNFFGRVAFTNGATSIFSAANVAQAVSLKVGHNMPHYQGAVSFYDDFHKVPAVDPFTFATITDRVRSTRWGYAGIGHLGDLSVLGEIAAGTDKFNEIVPGSMLAGRARNLLAGWAEADWTFSRAYNLRVRFDRMELERGGDPLVRDLNSHNRWALEGEYLPVPFAEVRWTLRYIDHQAASLQDERQAYVQMHFSY